MEEAHWVVNQMQALRLAEGLPYRDMAVFYRINSLSRSMEDALRHARIPYRIVGGIRFYERAEIRDMLAYLRLAVNPANDLALLRVINKPRRGIGKVALENLRRRALDEKISLYEASRRTIEAGDLRGRAAKGLGEFLDQVDTWHKDRLETDPDDLLERILEETDYIANLGDPHSLDAITRRENIGELKSTLKEWSREEDEEAKAGLPALDAWLEDMALTTSSDTAVGTSEGVSLMTIHCAKGLEFTAVFVVGLEEPLFPLARAIEEQGNAEEERRLFYVAVTRAKERLFVTHCRARLLYGQDALNPPSRFLFELPEDLFEGGKKPSATMTPLYVPPWARERDT
jgi:DNA helicase-2/ATP-dependent DNA helicase PcrA